jgi:hypothetical protein
LSLREEAMRSTFVRAGVTLLVIGWLPLLLYVAYELLTGAKGNPIGLGLLMVCSTPVGLVLIVIGLVQAAKRARS